MSLSWRSPWILAHMNVGVEATGVPGSRLPGEMSGGEGEGENYPRP